MLSRDFIMREVQRAAYVLASALAQAMGLRQERRYDEAADVVDAALNDLPAGPLLPELDADEVAALCTTARGFSPELAFAAADLLHERGLLLTHTGRPGEARRPFEQALDLYRRALAVPGADVPFGAIAKLDDLEQQLR